MFNRGNLPFGSRPDAGAPRRDGYGPPPGQQHPPPGYDPRQGPPGGGYPPAQQVPARRPAPGPAPGGGGRGGRQIQLKPVKSPGGNAYAFGNVVAVSRADFPPSPDGHDIYILVNGNYVLSARPTETCMPGEIGLTDRQRTWAGVSLGPHDIVMVQNYDHFGEGGGAYLASVDVEVGFAGRKTTEVPYDQDELGVHHPSTPTRQPAAAAMATELTVQSERAFQKQPHINLVSKSKNNRVGKGGRRWYKDVGLGFRTPKTAIEGSYIDKKCPFTGLISIRGRILTGTVVSTKMHRTLIIRREYLHFIPKYSRYEKRHKNLAAHVSPAFRVEEGDQVTVGQCRPLSKTVRFNVLRVLPRTGKAVKKFNKF